MVIAMLLDPECWSGGFDAENSPLCSVNPNWAEVRRERHKKNENYVNYLFMEFRANEWVNIKLFLNEKKKPSSTKYWSSNHIGTWSSTSLQKKTPSKLNRWNWQEQKSWNTYHHLSIPRHHSHRPFVNLWIFYHSQYHPGSVRWFLRLSVQLILWKFFSNELNLFVK